MSERLQKFLSRAGVASRRHAEALITQGRVTVNNQTVTTLGSRVEPGDLVTVDGRLVQLPEAYSYFILYKPVGVVTTMEDPQGRPTVAQFVRDVGTRVYPVGRLDFDAEGALLMTNDGDLAHALTHPKFEVRRTYLAKVKGVPTRESLARLVQGVRLEDGEAKALVAEVFEAAERNTWIRLVVAEGRPHLIKRMCAAIGHPVLRLFRPSHGGVSVKGLKPGDIRPLTKAEVERAKAIGAGKEAPEEELTLPPRRHGHGGVREGFQEGTAGARAGRPGGAKRASPVRTGRAGHHATKRAFGGRTERGGNARGARGDRAERRGRAGPGGGAGRGSAGGRTGRFGKVGAPKGGRAGGGRPARPGGNRHGGRNGGRGGPRR